jgi:hypothetical protein
MIVKFISGFQSGGHIAYANLFCSLGVAVLLWFIGFVLISLPFLS